MGCSNRNDVRQQGWQSVFCGRTHGESGETEEAGKEADETAGQWVLGMGSGFLGILRGK